MTDSTETNLLICQGVELQLDDETLGLPAFRLEPGDRLGLRCPSVASADRAGSLLLGLEQLATERVTLFGQDAGRRGDPHLLRARRRLAWAPCSPSFLATVSLSDNVAIPLRDRSQLGSAMLRQRVDQALACLGLDHRGDELPHALTVTQRYLAGVARAVLAAPELLLLATPPAALTADRQAGLERLLRPLLADRATAILLLVARGLFPVVDVDNIIDVASHPRSTAMSEGRRR